MFFSCTDDKLSVLGEEFQARRGCATTNSTVYDKITEQEDISLDDRRFDLLQMSPDNAIRGKTATTDAQPFLGTPKLNPRSYLEKDTIMICNPNAMSYQHMINYPHAYYLKFFLNK